MKEFLRCLLLPLAEETLLLPYSAVAEVVERDLTENEKGLKDIVWRGLTIPLIYLDESECKLNKSVTKRDIAILNRFSEKSKVDFVGIVLCGVPSMHRYKRNDIEWIGNATRPYGLMEVAVRNQKAIIPRLEALQPA
jgi:chemotaxis signal transduction protein